MEEYEAGYGAKQQQARMQFTLMFLVLLQLHDVYIYSILEGKNLKSGFEPCGAVTTNF